VTCCCPASTLQVHGPFQMLNIINFLVFRITRTVLYSLEAVLAPASDPAYIVSPQSLIRDPLVVVGCVKILSHNETALRVHAETPDNHGGHLCVSDCVLCCASIPEAPPWCVMLCCASVSCQQLAQTLRMRLTWPSCAMPCAAVEEARIPCWGSSGQPAHRVPLLPVWLPGCGRQGSAHRPVH
jgi:hypothetical protein